MTANELNKIAKHNKYALRDKEVEEILKQAKISSSNGHFTISRESIRRDTSEYLICKGFSLVHKLIPTLYMGTFRGVEIGWGKK